MSSKRPALVKELPEDIHTNILSRADVKTLMRSKCVCTRWSVLISEPHFVKLHLQRSVTAKPKSILFTNTTPDLQILDSVEGKIGNAQFPLLDSNRRSYDFIKIVGSCNGLICLLLIDEGTMSKDRTRVVIYNPSTRIYNELPKPLEMDQSIIDYWGFGYDSFGDDYKVVLGVNINKSTTKLMVLNLKHNYWRTIYDGPAMAQIFCPGFPFAQFLDGALHWIKCPLNKEGLSNPTRVEGRTCFNLSEEAFKEMASVDLPRVGNEQRFALVGLFEGSLLVIYFLEHREVKIRSDMWIMKEYNVNGSWMKLFEIPLKYESLLPICFFGNEELLLEASGDEYELVAYSLSTREIRTIAKCSWYCLFDETLVSPHGV